MDTITRTKRGTYRFTSHKSDVVYNSEEKTERGDTKADKVKKVE